MARPGRIIEVDFKKGRKPSSGGFAGGPRFLITVFATVLALELVITAALMPSMMSSGIFAPTLIVVAVLAAVGAKRAMVRYEINRLHRVMTTRAAQEDKEEDRDKTLH